jgi:hypothetical protein
MSVLCTRNPVSLAVARNVEAPDKTDSYMPVKNGQFVDTVRAAFEALGWALDYEAYGLTCKDQRFFFTHRYVQKNSPDGSEHAVAVGGRNSYDRSIAAGLAIGANVFVCDNLCFSGDDFAVLRRHTSNVWRDLAELVKKAAATAETRHARLGAELHLLKEVGISDDRAYELFGLALGHEVVAPTQINAALRDWKEPRHPEFADRNLWSWYNAVNEALKTSTADTMLTRHANLHRFALSQIDPRVLEAARAEHIIDAEVIDVEAA